MAAMSCQAKNSLIMKKSSLKYEIVLDTVKKFMYKVIKIKEGL
jgi:hypothetical protein